MATLAASSHNTQPWSFSISEDAITIGADLSRRCPVVDPDDAHLYKSLGCAAENLVQAAAAQGLAATLQLDAAARCLHVELTERSDAVPGSLADAIVTRQCTRNAYDGQPISEEDLATLEADGSVGLASCVQLKGAAALERMAELVTRGNLAQLHDDAFRRELVAWVRFNPASALRSGDGLAGRTTGQPSVPTWLGTSLQKVLISAERQARLDAQRIRSSSGVAVFVTPGDDVADWVDAGRAYQRFALRAELLDIRSAFVNQPIEVGEIRPELESWLELDGARAQLAVRFGRGAKLPYSLRRRLRDVVAPSAP